MAHIPSAAKAMQTLAEIQSKTEDTAGLAYLCMPNVVLTLAGARGYGDGVFYNENKTILTGWERELAKTLEALGEISQIRYATHISKNPNGKWYVGFDFIDVATTALVMKNYSFITNEDADKFIQQVDDDVNALEVLHEIIHKKPQFADHGESLRHTIATGILLGYPEKAVLQTAPLFERPYEKYSELGLVGARIAYADKYKCPQPTYDYPAELADDPAIKKHEKSWSTVLTDFYDSSFFDGLQNDLYFADKIATISQN